MKPGFALNLSHDGIGLLRRAPGGWVLIGEASLEDTRLAQTLAALRARATGPAAEAPLATKLVIPNSQILYTEVEAPGPAAASRRAAIRTALEGRTPYAVDDLVFDWSGTGKVVQVAVVARETLAEAEAFAEEHDFAPVSFVAIPENGDFGGEPFFGPTTRAAEILPEGARVDRDQDPVRITATELPEADAPDAETAPGEDLAAADEAAVDIDDLSDVADMADIAAEDDLAAEAAAADAAAESDQAAKADEAPETGPAAEAEAEIEPPAAGDAAEPAAEPVGTEPGALAIRAEAENPIPAPETVSPELAALETVSAEPVSPETVPPETMSPDRPATDASDAAPEAAPEPTAEDRPATEAAPPVASTAEPPEAKTASEPPAAAPVAPAASDDKPAAEPAAEADAEEAAPQAAQATPDGGPVPPAPGAREAPYVLTFSSRRVAARPDPDEAVAARPLGPAAELTKTEAAPRKLGAALAKETERPDAATAPAVAKGPEKTAQPAEGAPPAIGPAPIGKAVVAAYQTGLSALLSRLRGGQDKPEPETVAGQTPPRASGPEGPKALDKAGPDETGSGQDGPRQDGPDKATVGRTEPAPKQPAPKQPAPDKLKPAAPGKPAVIARPLTGPVADIRAPKPNPKATVAAKAAKSPPPAAAKTGPQDTTATMTVFGARRRAAIGAGTPRYLGPLLTIALVLFIAAVALWSSLLGVGTSDPEIAALPAGTAAPDAAAPEPAPLPASEPAPQPEPEPEQEPTAEPDLAPVIPEAPQDPVAGTGVPEAPATSAEPPTEAEIASRYAATGIWIGAPAPGAAPEPGARSTLAPIRPDPAGPAAPEPQIPPPEDFATRAAPLAAPAPPPYETLLALAVGGTIGPTPEGTITPDFVTLFTGKPPRVPPARPAVAAPEPEPDPLEGKTPRPRPAGLTPEPPAEAPAEQPAGLPAETPAATTDDAALTPAETPAAEETDLAALAADPALAGKTPRGRPASVLAAAAAVAAAAAAAEPDPSALEGATRLAVASSRRPAAKPRDFSRAVDAAVAAAISSAAPEPAAAAAPEPAPSAAASAPTTDVDEPEPVAAAPNIPTRASVAKQATISKAIRLNQVNLIGVFGSSSNRRALIRMGNGKFIKVQIGDRLDGGKVTGISDRQLTYVKNGKTLVLEMPREG